MPPKPHPPPSEETAGYSQWVEFTNHNRCWEEMREALLNRRQGYQDSLTSLDNTHEQDLVYKTGILELSFLIDLPDRIRETMKSEAEGVED